MNTPELSREEIALAMFTAMLPRTVDAAEIMSPREAVVALDRDVAAAWTLADMWIAKRPYEPTT